MQAWIVLPILLSPWICHYKQPYHWSFYSIHNYLSDIRSVSQYNLNVTDETTNVAHDLMLNFVVKHSRWGSPAANRESETMPGRDAGTTEPTRDQRSKGMYDSHISLIILIRNLCTPFKYINNVSHLIPRDILPLIQHGLSNRCLYVVILLCTSNFFYCNNITHSFVWFYRCTSIRSPAFRSRA